MPTLEPGRIDGDRRETEIDQKSVVNSVLKACRLLECFSLDHRELTLADIAQETGWNKTTVHRLLQTLVLAGWLVRGPEGRYRVSMRLFRVGAVAQADLSLRHEALPALKALAEEFGDTAYLMVPAAGGAMCVELVEGSSPVKVSSVGLGTVLPYHTAAGPVAILAFDEELQAEVFAVGELARFTPATVTDPAVLRERLRRVVRDGYAISEEDYLRGVSAVGAPVFDATGKPVATVSLGGTTDRFSGERLLAIIERVTSAAREVSARLGH